MYINTISAIRWNQNQKGWFEIDNPNSNPYSEENEFELYNAYNKGYEQGLLDSGSLNAQSILDAACKVFENSKRVNKARKIATWEWLKIITRYALIAVCCAKHI